VLEKVWAKLCYCDSGPCGKFTSYLLFMLPTLDVMVPSSHFSPFIIQELPDFLTPIFERHAQLWATEIEEPTAMLTKKHGTSMSEFSRDLLTAIKDHTTPTPSFALSPRAVDVSNLHQAECSASKATPETRFWKDAVQYEHEVEQSKEKTTFQNQMPDTPRAPASAQTNLDQGTRQRENYDTIAPSFSLLLPSETWLNHCPILHR
jgi:hypothetical protein